jgi:hypothetical protein
MLWLEARGDIEMDSDGDELLISRGRAAPAGDLSRIEAAASRMLAETAAYRSYFATADASALLADADVRPTG